jgi:Xaa-Pro aminopeptidase
MFIHHRARLKELLLPNSLVVVNANDILPSNADGTLPFRQNSDLFYLAGTEQEETILMLCPEAQEEEMREILFLRETNDLIATWEGHKLTKEEAQKLSGIQRVEWLSEFPALFHR